MKKIAFSLAILMLNCYSLRAQQVATFDVTYNILGFIEIGGGITQKPNDNYIGSGYGIFTGYLFEIDTSGVVQWAKSYSSSQLTDIKPINSSSNYIVTGSQANQALLMEVDPTGNIVWAKRYDAGSGGEQGKKVINTSDGGYLVCGHTYDHLGTRDSTDLYILKTNSAGVKQWDKVIYPNPGVLNHDYLYDVAEVSDGYVFVGRYSETNNDNDGYDGIIFKTNTAGTVQWVRKYDSFTGSNQSEGLYSAYALTGNDVLISGFHEADVQAIRVDKDGVGTWGYSYDAGGLFDAAEGWDAFPTNDGNYAVLGAHISFLNFGTFLMKIRPSNGDTIFTTKYAGLPIEPFGLQANDNGYVVGFSNAFNMQVRKTDEFGMLIDTNCSVVTVPSFANSGYSPSFTAIAPSYPVYTSSETNATPTVTNVLGFSSNVVCENIVLPIELLSFNGYSDGVRTRLEWSTASEVNNSHFTILRSSNGQEFKEIAVVQGAGNSNTMIDYFDYDHSPPDGTSYYILKQTDYNGSFSYSNIIAVNHKSEQNINIYPNPVRNQFNLVFNIAGEENYEVSIYNSLGQLVFNEVRTENSENSMTIDGQSFENGVYFVRVKNDLGQLWQQKFIKQ